MKPSNCEALTMIIVWIGYLLAALFWLFDHEVPLYWDDCFRYLDEEN